MQAVLAIAIAAAAAATLLGAGEASASPCGAQALPVGHTFRGPVLHVLDGSTLCIAMGPAPSDWAALRISDAPPESTRGLLMAVAFAKDVDCTVVETGEAEAVAVCSIGGRRLGALAREPKARRAAGAWR